MDLFSFYFKQIVTQSVMDWVFEQAQLADHNMSADALSVGIMEGFEVNENNLGADMSVGILQGAAYALEGERIYNGTPLTNQDCTADEFGVPTTIQNIGNERWLSVFARFTRRLEDPAIDGNGLEVYTRQYEDVELIIRQAAEATAGAATRPALLDGAVLLADVSLAFGQSTIQTAHIDVTRRQDWMRLVGTNLGTFAHGNPYDAIEDIFSTLDTWADLGSPFTFSQNWHGGTTPEGPTPPVTNVKEALNAIVYDLAKDTTLSGAELVGILDLSTTYVSWASASVYTALIDTASILNAHIGGAAPQHPDTSISAVLKSGPPNALGDGSVSSQLQALLDIGNIYQQDRTASRTTFKQRFTNRNDDSSQESVKEYFMDGKRVWCNNCYPKSGSATILVMAAGGGGAGDTASFLLMDQGTLIQGTRQNVTALAEKSMYTSSDWNYHKTVGPDGDVAEL